MTHLTALFQGGSAPRPALHHLGWPWLRTPSAYDYPWNARGTFAVQLTTIEVGPGARISSLHFTFALFFSSSSPLSGRPARRIQSDSDPKWSSACRFSTGCCHGTVQSDLLYPSLLKKTRAPSGRPPLAFSRRPLDSLLAGFLFSFLILDVALLQLTFSPSGWTSDHGAWREFGLLLQPPLLSSSEERLGCFLKALLSLLPIYFLHVLLLSPRFLLGGYCMHWRSFSRCLLTGCHWLCLWLPTFWTTFLRWSGCASLLAGGEHLRGLWVSARCMLSSFVSLGFTKSWVGQVALRSPINRHALDLAVSLDDQGH